MSAWTKVKEHVKTRWTAGKLGRSGRDSGTPYSTHCALGIIGYTQIPNYDEMLELDWNGNADRGYYVLEGGTARDMVARLAAKLRITQQHFILERLGSNYMISDNGLGTDRAVVMGVNDHQGQGAILEAVASLEAEDLAVAEWLEAERIEKDRIACEETLASKKFKKKDLRVEYMPQLDVVERVKEVVNGS